MLPRLSSRAAFTLIELLVTVAIIAALIAILLPALGRARNSAQRSACAANLLALGRATAIYAGEWDGRTPYANHAAYPASGAPNHVMIRTEGTWLNYERKTPLVGRTLAPYLAGEVSRMWVCPATGATNPLAETVQVGGESVTRWQSLNPPYTPTGPFGTNVWAFSSYSFWMGERANNATARYFRLADKVTAATWQDIPARLPELAERHLLAQDVLYAADPFGYGNHPAAAATMKPSTSVQTNINQFYPGFYLTNNSVADTLGGFQGANALKGDFHVEFVTVRDLTRRWASTYNQMLYLAVPE